jgi:phosphate starvation-inducible PhoH-like protein
LEQESSHPRSKKTTSKKQKGKPQAAQVVAKMNLSLSDVSPITENQAKTFQAWNDGYHLMLHGLAGTGKTLVAMYLGLKELHKGQYDKIVLVRSAVPSRSQGFLPGSLEEKAEIFELPFKAVTNEMYERDDAYGILKSRGVINFMTTSYIRGITLNNAIVIVDEIQNMTFAEISTVITRMGQNSRLIIMGDFRQTDLARDKEKQGIHDLLRIVDRLDSFALVEFGYDDIVRSGLVRDFIIAKDQLGITE